MYETIVWVAAAIVALIFLVKLNRRRRPALEKAYASFDRVTQGAGAELESFSRLFEQVREAIGDRSAFAKRGYQGDSAEVAELVLRQVDSLEAMSEELQRVLAEGDALLHPAGPLAQAANMMTSSRYLHCLNLVHSESLQVHRFPEVDDFPTNPRVTFDAFFSLMRTRRLATETNLQKYTDSLIGLDVSVKSLEAKFEQLDQIESRIQSSDDLANTDLASQRVGGSSQREDQNWFSLPSLFEKLVPQLERDSEKLVDASQQDPLGVKQTRLPSLSQKLDDVLSVAKAIEAAQNQLLPSINEATRSLEDRSVNTRWIERRKRELADEADRLITTAVRDEVTELASRFDENLTEFSLRVAQINDLALRLDQQIAPALETAKQTVVDAREEVAKQLDISSTMALREMDYSPDDELQRAQQQSIAARAGLDRGDVESVNGAIGEIEVEIDQANRYVQDSLLALKEFDGEMTLQTSSANKLLERLRKFKGRVEQVRRDFHPNALVVPNTQQEGRDVEAQTQGQSLTELYRESLDWMRDAKSQLESSDREFRRGKILLACNSVELLRFEFEELTRFIDGMEGHVDRIVLLADQNKIAFDRNLRRIEKLQEALANDGVQSDANAMLTRLREQLGEWQPGQSSAGKPNPIADQNRIEQLATAIHEIETRQKLDSNAYQEVVRALEGAKSELLIAEQLVKNSHADGIPDSQQISEDQEQVEQLSQRVRSLEAAVDQCSEDLTVLDRQCTETQVDISIVNGRLRDELKAARHASSLIAQAADAVFKAASFQGPYDIVVVGHAGSDELQTARESLAQGEYAIAIASAQESKRNAENGLIAAEAQVNRQRRMIARQARENRFRRTRGRG